jgi:hypothetical protein
MLLTFSFLYPTVAPQITQVNSWKAAAAWWPGIGPANQGAMVPRDGTITEIQV